MRVKVGEGSATRQLTLAQEAMRDRRERLRDAALEFFSATGDLVGQAQAWEMMERLAGDLAVFGGDGDFGAWKSKRDFLVHDALARAEALVCT